MQDCPFMTHIFLGNGMVVQVDPADWLLYSRYHWYAKYSRGGPYAAALVHRYDTPFFLYLHRLISHCPKGMITHHSDCNTLNNHRVNLVNMSQNEHNDLHKFLKIARQNPSAFPKH